MGLFDFFKKKKENKKAEEIIEKCDNELYDNEEEINSILEEYDMKIEYKKNDKNLRVDDVKVIKIGKEALFEFIYENFIDETDCYLDVNSVDVTTSFDINWEKGEFIFCAYKSEDEDGNFLSLPENIDLQKVMKNMPDTTTTMFADDRYKVYTKKELREMSEK